MITLTVLETMQRDAKHAEAYRLEHGYADGSLFDAMRQSNAAYFSVLRLIEAAEAGESGYCVGWPSALIFTPAKASKLRAEIATATGSAGTTGEQP